MSNSILISEIVSYLVENVFSKHLEAIVKKHSHLKEYRYNPVVVRYLSQLMEGEYTAIGVAKALYYPRILGTSINTSFGTWIQNVFINLGVGGARGSLIKGIDIEFVDKIDGRYKWCQLKSGPNTINSGDVAPIIKNFTDTIRLGRTNNIKDVVNTDFIIGVIYGRESDLSTHYLKINEVFPVIAGEVFWHRLTGDPCFYAALFNALTIAIDEMDTKGLIEEGYTLLAQQIKESDSFLL